MGSVPGVTMKEVAAAVGVSVASVSNAYNRPEKLSEDVRARILSHRCRARLPRTERGRPGPAARPRRRGRHRLRRTALLRLPRPVRRHPARRRGRRARGELHQHQPAADPQRQPGRPGGRDLRRGRRVPGDLRRRHPPGRDRGPASRHPRGAHGGLRRREATSSPSTSLAAGRALGAHLAELGHRDVAVVVDLEDADRTVSGWAGPAWTTW